MTGFDVAVETHPHGPVLALFGELDMGSAHVLEEALERAEAEAQAEPGLPLVVDLRQLAFMDSSGLRVLLRAHQRAATSGRRLALVRGPIEVHRVFTIALPDGRLSFVDAPEDAWA